SCPCETLRRKYAGEPASGARRAFNLEARAMPLQHVLDNGETKARAALAARAAGIDAIEPFGDPREMLLRNADAGIGNRERYPLAAAEPADRHLAVRRRVAHRIENQVRERAVDFLFPAAKVCAGFDLQHDIARTFFERERLLADSRQHGVHI